MKRNQHVLFIMVFVLCLTSSFQNITRICAEFGFISSNKSYGDRVYNGMKAIDRPLISAVLFEEVLILGFICYVFMETTKATRYLREATFSANKIGLIVLLGAIVTLLVITNIAIVVLHSLVAAGIVQEEENIAIFQEVVLISIGVLNVYGYKLYKSLKESKRKIKEMLKSNNKSIENLATPSDEISSSTISSTNSVSPTETMTKEQEKTYKIKKTALKKSLSIQVGLSISLAIQLVGFIFVPIGVSLNYYFLVFHILSNCGLILFISLLLSIYHPLSVVQKLFKVPSNDKLKEIPMVQQVLKVVKTEEFSESV
ncbi:hypothetical protein ABK040_003406 [Willaertia magna]